MNPKLQQAMVAARAGQAKTAQFLLTQVLKDDPEEAQAWFLLSHLVDSDQRQRVYLQKTIALDPNHEIAAQRLSELDRLELQFPTEPVAKAPDLSEMDTAATMPALPRVGEPEDAVTQPLVRPTPSVDDARLEQQRAMTRWLILLSFAALVILILLIYLIFATF